MSIISEGVMRVPGQSKPCPMTFKSSTITYVHDMQLPRFNFNARSMQGTDRTGPPAPGVKRIDGVPSSRTSSHQSRVLIIPAPFGQGTQAFSNSISPSYAMFYLSITLDAGRFLHVHNSQLSRPVASGNVLDTAAQNRDRNSTL